MSTSPETTQPTLFGDDSATATDGTLDMSLPALPEPGDATGCRHVSALLANPQASQGVLSKYKTVVAWHARRIQDTSPPAKRRKVSAPTCDTCHATLSRPFACLSCAYAGCWPGGHITGHLGASGHSLCVDTRSGSVFCAVCDDFIYDATLDALHLSTVLSVEEHLTRFQEEKKVKVREPFQPWTPSENEAAALQGATVLPCQGRRGLINLGQTCFLNVILQCFIHNPLLRNYFLGDKHNSKLCKYLECTCCEMDTLFAEVYSSNQAPFGPTKFLATMWKVSAEMSGYAQQDAHEFFIAALDQIHTKCRGSTNVSCNCIIHQTFAGQLQSDVTCERCGNVTSTFDPMLDISLELRTKSGEVGSENTLAGCLRRFTKPEKLGAKGYSCSKCTKAHEAIKRLSIHKLPPVLSFQFKRFEHKTTSKAVPQKIDTPVRFPATLNMAPYTTLVMNASKDGDGSTYPGPEAMYEYDLFAVINHEGQMDNGHYTNFARFRDEWYRFDDDKVTLSNLGACLHSNAYMCFYVKHHLDYEPYMKPTYRQRRDDDIVREQEQEKLKEMARMKEVDDALMATIAGD